MDTKGRTRAQLDGAFRPAPAVREPHPSARWAFAQLKPTGGSPVLLFNDEDELPVSLVRGSTGTILRLNKDGEGTEGADNALEEPTAEEVAEVAPWARSIVGDVKPPAWLQRPDPEEEAEARRLAKLERAQDARPSPPAEEGKGGEGGGAGRA